MLEKGDLYSEQRMRNKKQSMTHLLTDAFEASVCAANVLLPTSSQIWQSIVKGTAA
jgi:isoleucyl-tRNA synthetase